MANKMKRLTGKLEQLQELERETTLTFGKVKELAKAAKELDRALPEMGVFATWESDLLELLALVSPAFASPSHSYTASLNGETAKTSLPPEQEDVWVQCAQFKKTSPSGLDFTAIYWPGSQELPQRGIVYSFAALSEKEGANDYEQYEFFAEILPQWIEEKKFSSPEEAAILLCPSEGNRSSWCPEAEGLLLRSANTYSSHIEADKKNVAEQMRQQKFELVKRALGPTSQNLRLDAAVAKCGRQLTFHLGRATPKTLVKACQSICRNFSNISPDSNEFLREMGALTLEEAFSKALLIKK